MADDVYWRLRHEITYGILRPNSTLVEEEIAARMGVSRTPVRESLQRLGADGLIESQRRRWIVRDHSQGEIVDIYQVRAALESHAARLAATSATAEQRIQIIEIGKSSFNVDVTSLHNRVTYNEHFHDLVVASANNERLTHLLAMNKIFHFNYNLASLYSEKDLVTSSKQHHLIAEAILAEDSETAGRIAREHVEFSLTLVIQKTFTTTE